MGEKLKKQFKRCLSFSNYLYGKYVEIIGLKAPGNYLDQFWFNIIPMLLCEGPKPNMFMISGLLNPREPLFMLFNMPNYFKNLRKVWKHF